MNQPAAIDYTTDDNRRTNALLGKSRPLLEATIECPEDVTALRDKWAGEEAIPVLVEAREDGIDHSWGGLDVRTLLRGEQSAGRFSAHSIELAPGSGLPAHYHEDTHTYIVVTEGDVLLGVGGRVERAGAYSFGYVPPHTRQLFRNESGAPARLTIVYSPAGVERAFAQAHEQPATQSFQIDAYGAVLARYGIHFDARPLEGDELTNAVRPPLAFEINMQGDLQALREEFSRQKPIPRLVSTASEEIGTAPGQVYRKELLSGDDSGGHAMLNLLSGPPGFKAPPHFQPSEEEFFVVVDGELQMTFATQERVLSRGAMAFCPRNCTHGFVNNSEAPTRFVTLNSPAGHERAMAAVRRLIQGGASPDELHERAAIGGFVFHSRSALGK